MLLCSHTTLLPLVPPLTEPVRGVRIVDDGGTELVGVAGPYILEQRPSLTCRAAGGDPSPTVTWWKDGRLIDSTYHLETPPR